MIDLLLESWRKQLAPVLNGLWTSLDFWRLFSLCAFSILVVAFVYRKKILAFLTNADRNNHDKEIFKRASELMNEEDIHYLISDLQSDDSYEKDELMKVFIFIHYFEQESNQFLNKTIKETSIELIKALSGLTYFCSTHCFRYGPPGKSCLYPDYNIDRNGNGEPKEMAFYDEKQTELHKIAKGAEEKYREFRKKVKEILYI